MENMEIMENMEDLEDVDDIEDVEDVEYVEYVEYVNDVDEVEGVDDVGDVEDVEDENFTEDFNFNYAPQVEGGVQVEYRDHVLAEIERLLDDYESTVDYDDQVMLEDLEEMNVDITNLCCDTQEIKFVPSTVHIYPFVLCNTPEDRALREKYNQFAKFIEPIQRVIDQLAPDDIRGHKLSGLLKMLLNPSRKIRLQTLAGYEDILSKLADLHNTFRSINFGAQYITFLKAILQKPDGNYSIREAFRSMKQYSDSDIRTLPKRMPYFRGENFQKDNIPHALKGEILQLDERFSVTLDPAVHSSKSVNLICYLLDKELPCVPPIAVVVPEHYPSEPLDWSFSEHEYAASMFLKTVKEIFSVRLMQLPKYSSLTRLLEVWEMAVRKACSPKANVNVINDLSEIFGM